MESNERIRSQQEEMDGNDPFAGLLVDFLDGTLSDDTSQKVKEHLSSCARCGSITHSMLQAGILTERMKNSKTEYMDSLQESRRELQIDAIKQRIQKEQRRLETNEDNTAVKSPRRHAVSFFTRRWALTSTAAGIVVLLFVSFLFINGNSVFNKFFRLGGSNFILSPANTKGVDDSAGGRAQELQSAGQSQASMADLSEKATTQDATFSANANPPLFTEEGIREASARILIIPDYSADMAMLVQGAVSYLEISNSNTSYVFIAAYPDAMVQSKVTALQDIKEKLNFLSLTTKFEFISRENLQKLVEYTSKENATLLQANADKNSADFLVISIYRG